MVKQSNQVRLFSIEILESLARVHHGNAHTTVSNL